MVIHLSNSDVGNAARTFVPCHICRADLAQPFWSECGYEIVRCRGCGLWYVNPQPTTAELEHFYSEYDDGEQWRQGEESFNRGIRNVILRYKRTGRVLDVGCGSGNFLRCMREAGFKAFGIEPSRSGSDYARDINRLDVFTGSVERYNQTAREQRFDIVTLLNVLEHLTHPHRSLGAICDLLEQGGLLIVVVPDARFHAIIGRIRRFFGVRDPYWLKGRSVLSGFKLPDHLTSFTPATLRKMLESGGFSVLQMANAPVVLNPEKRRNIIKYLVRATFEAIRVLSFGHLLFGYSTLAIASVPRKIK